jgi:flagellar hook protein FlgE
VAASEKELSDPMMRSMFTAIGGLKNHQVMLDVTANNIANVNTVGYKTQRASFETMMSQTLRGASAPVPDGIGGTAPTAVGLGMTLGSIGSVMTQGSLQTTGQWSDLAINGDGYFAVAHDVTTTAASGGAAPLPATPDISFTRAGNFTVDKDGWLVTQHGQYVLATAATSQGPPATFGTTLSGIQLPTAAQSVSVDQNGVISYDLGGRQIAGQLAVAKFPNPAALMSVGGNMLKDTADSGLFDPNVATPTGPGVIWGPPNTNGLGAVSSGTLEMSNVDLAQEFTNMIVAQRGFSANTKVITTSDEMLQELVNLKR